MEESGGVTTSAPHLLQKREVTAVGVPQVTQKRGMSVLLYQQHLSLKASGAGYGLGMIILFITLLSHLELHHDVGERPNYEGH